MINEDRMLKTLTFVNIHKHIKLFILYYIQIVAVKQIKIIMFNL